MSEQHNNDWRDYSLSHSWGKKPEQKAREKEYNAWYYKEHKREILNKRKERRKNQKREAKIVWGNITGKTVYEDGPRGRKVAINKKVTPKHRNPDEYYTLVEKYKTKSKKKLDKKNSAVQDINKFKKVLKKSGYEVRSDNEAQILWKEFRKDLGYKDEMFVVETKNTQKKMKVKKPGLISRGKNLVSNLFHEENDMNEYYGNNDWRDYLAHSWGTKPEQKKREKEYNAWYYKTHKEEIMRKRGQKGKRPLARETNVTGKGKVERRGEGLTESNSINRRDENGLLNPPESFKSAINEMYKNYGKNGSYGDPYSPNSAYSNFGEFQAEMMELGFKFNNDSEAKQAWISFKNNIDLKNGKTSKAEKKAPTGNKLDKPSNPKGKIGKTISKKISENISATNARGIKNYYKESGRMAREEDYGGSWVVSSQSGGSAEVSDAYDRMRKFSPAKALTKRKKKKED